jgi:hypothetical protein
LTASAAAPTTPIVAASGAMPAASAQSTLAMTRTPNAPMHAALNSAARERAATPMPSTASVIA